MYTSPFRFCPFFDYNDPFIFSEYSSAGYGSRTRRRTGLVLIWLSIDMTPFNSGLYWRGERPIRASTAVIDGQRFVSLGVATQGSVPPRAWEFKEPLHRQASFSITGVPKAIDWAAFADWFDLSVHWRGYIPEDALAGDWWCTLAEYIVRTEGGYRVKEKVVEWRMNRIRHLRRYIDSVIITLPISSNHIPTPRMDDLAELAQSHPSEAGAFHAMARSRAHFADLAGFFCYSREAFAEFFEDGEIDHSNPPSIFWTPWEKQKKTGYILDPANQWKTHNIPMWLAHGLPVHYPWSESDGEIPRLSRLDPEFLQAHDEDVLGAYDPHSNETRVSFKVQESEEYDEWLQMSSHPGYNQPAPLFPSEGLQQSRVEFMFNDYEDWEFRPIDNAVEAVLLSEIFYFHNKVDPHTQQQIRRIYGYRPRQEETLERVSILLPFSTLNWPFSHRESYKFVYATQTVGAPVVVNRTLLDRISDTTLEEGEIVQYRDRGSDDSRSVSSTSRTSRRRPKPYDREGSAVSGDRSVSPARSGRSGSSRYSPVPSLLQLRLRGVGLTDPPAQAPANHHNLSAESRARIESILPSGTDHFPKSLDKEGHWSAAFLRIAMFSFPRTDSEWRIRAWRVMNPSWSTTRLLNAALSFHIPFRLCLPSSTVSLFARQKSSYSASDLASRPFYSAGYRDTNIAFDNNGAGYVQRYLASVVTLLLKPNAGAFLFEGGILSRIAREFAPTDLLNRALMGPSAAMTLWSSSMRDNDRDTVREFVSPYEEQILIGESSLYGTQTEPHSLWPDAHTFALRFGHWQGIWTPACEEWFQMKLQDLLANRPEAKTRGGWRNELRQTRRVATLTADTWEHIKQDIEAMDGPSWEGMAVSTVMDIDTPGNQFALPYAQ